MRPVGQVAEGGVGGDERRDRARGGFLHEGVPEGVHLLSEGLCVGLVLVRVGGVGLGELVSHQGRGLRHADRVEPEVGVGGHVVVVTLVIMPLVTLVTLVIMSGLSLLAFLLFCRVVGVRARVNQLGG